MFYTDDPVADFLSYDAECEREMDNLPRCSECDEPIQDDFCYEFNGELICPDCLEANHRKLVEDYVE
jgi:formylmethanofuran dehydrogenase subunit E